MPELPEVEQFARHLAPQVTGRQIVSAEVRCLRTIRPLTPESFRDSLRGSLVTGVRRRAKYLLFDLAPSRPELARCLLGHLGMTGRIFIQPSDAPLPRHTVAALDLGATRLVFEDARKFGRFVTDISVLDRLGPEPLSPGFSSERLAAALRGSRRAVKTCLMDPGVVAGIGNIYASESLFRARIHPQRTGGQLTLDECRRLRTSIRRVLTEAIRRAGSQTLETASGREAVFYHGNAPDNPSVSRFRVYDRADAPCVECRTPIQRLVQAARSTYFCPSCQA